MRSSQICGTDNQSARSVSRVVSEMPSSARDSDRGGELRKSNLTRHPDRCVPQKRAQTRSHDCHPLGPIPQAAQRRRNRMRLSSTIEKRIRGSVESSPRIRHNARKRNRIRAARLQALRSPFRLAYLRPMRIFWLVLGLLGLVLLVISLFTRDWLIVASSVCDVVVAAFGFINQRKKIRTSERDSPTQLHRPDAVDPSRPLD